MAGIFKPARPFIPKLFLRDPSCSTTTSTVNSIFQPSRVTTTAPTRRRVSVGEIWVGRPVTDRYIVSLRAAAPQIASGKELLDFYIETLATAVGSTEEAKKRIYLVSADWISLSFGAHIDQNSYQRLKDMPDVAGLVADIYSEAREVSAVTTSTKFVPLNWNNRLFNLFKYASTNGDMDGDSGHWVVNIKPDARFVPSSEVLNYCTELLSRFVGSKRAPRERLYIVWCLPPFGFAAEMTEADANRLKGFLEVEQVLPDGDCSVKKQLTGAILMVCPSWKGPNPELIYRDLSFDNSDSEYDSEEEVKKDDCEDVSLYDVTEDIEVDCADVSIDDSDEDELYLSDSALEGFAPPKK